MRAAEPTTKTASCSIERRDCPRSCLAWKQSPLVGHYSSNLETPTSANIIANIAAQLSQILAHLGVHISMLTQLSAAANRQLRPVASHILAVTHAGSAVGCVQIYARAKIMVVAGFAVHTAAAVALAKGQTQIGNCQGSHKKSGRYD